MRKSVLSLLFVLVAVYIQAQNYFYVGNYQNATATFDGFTDQNAPTAWAYKHSASQLVYPATDLAGLTGKAIKKIKFKYQNESHYSSSTLYNMSMKLCLMEVSSQSLPTSGNPPARVWADVNLSQPNATLNYSVYLTDLASNQEDAEIEFDLSSNPYIYNGGNLLMVVTATTDHDTEITSGIMYYKYSPAHQQQCMAIWANDNQQFHQVYTQGATLSSLGARSDNDLPVVAFEYEDNGPCTSVANLEVSDITANSATVTWTNTSSSSQWLLEYSSSSTFQDRISHTVTGSPTFSISGLIAGTRYYVRVLSICGSQQSDPAVTHFNTICGEVASLNENFDNSATGFMPRCWTRHIISTSSFPQVVGASPSNGVPSNAIRFGSTKPAYISTPKMSVPLNTLRMRFKLNSEGVQNAPIIVGYMSDPENEATFVGVDTISNSVHQQYVNCEVLLTNVPDNGGANRYITFRYGDVGTKTQPTAWYYWLDVIDIHPIPNCQAPTLLNSFDITTNSAKIAFVENGTATAWEYAYTSDMTVADPSSLTVHGATNDTVTIAGLTASTSYKVWVRSVCSGTAGEWTAGNLGFRTECASVAAGWTDDFSQSNPDDNNRPYCWHMVQTYQTPYSSLAYPYVTRYTSHSAPGSLIMMTASANGSSVMAATPSISTPINTLQLSFYQMRGSTNYSSKIEVGVISDVNDPSTFIALANVTPSIDQWKYEELVLVGAPATHNHIAFRIENTSGVNNVTYYIDDVNISLASCVRPFNIVANNITTTSAEIGFTSVGSHSEWQYAYTTDMDVTTPPTTNEVTVTSNPFTIGGLTPNTKYRVWVRTNCGTDGWSNWSLAPVEFRTACETLTTSYTEKFGSNTTDNTTGIPYCWTNVVKQGTYPSVFIGKLQLYTETASNSANVIATPRFNSLNNLEMTFALTKVQTTSAPLTVGVMSDLSDTSTFIAVEDITPPTTNQKSVFDISFANVPSTHTYIAFRLKNSSAGTSAYYIDDVDVHLLPSCRRPRDLQIPQNDITATTVSMAWTSVGSETEWKIEYRKATETNWSSTSNINTNPYVLTGLEANTPYYARVKSVCSATDESVATDSIAFTTLCASVTLPYTENFESWSSSPFPTNKCWGSYKVSADEVFGGAQLVGRSNWTFDDDEYGINSNRVRVNIDQERKDWLVTPSIELLPNSMLEFDVAYTYYYNGNQAQQGGTDDKFMVIISRDGGLTWRAEDAHVWSNDGAAGAQSLNGISNIKNRINIDLGRYSGTIRIAFYVESTIRNSNNNLHIDSIMVLTATLPTVVTQPADNITANSASLHKEITQGTYPVTSEGFFYQAANDTRWVQTTNSDITSLQPGTTYRFYAYADINGVIYRGDTLQFTTTGNTSVVPPTVVTEDATDIQCTAVTLAKTVTAGTEPVTEEGWYYRKATDTQWIKTTVAGLAGLEQNTVYEFYAYASTATMPQVNGAVKTFTTQQCTGIGDTSSYGVELYPNPATSSVRLSLEGVEGRAEITIVDMLGKIMGRYNMAEGSEAINIDVSAWSGGNYVVHIVADNMKLTKLLIVKK